MLNSKTCPVSLPHIYEQGVFWKPKYTQNWKSYT